ncbi:hypothetical protein QNN03_18640 [Streptomyces sp. GXMU-J15]|uniref:Lipoprotein n=1 Tax=Streptomyces fuscus TaxID=3048495 RepID=A0ABT7J0T8_9ACTN|nr:MULTISPECIES: hypothetical protein [Streptomyces]MDL2078456.1 hypothetical protein [Streptomyces fuscus]SBT93741.1 hypothetical protein GA0115233_107022 [Streptomyces sp. DI166]
MRRALIVGLVVLAPLAAGCGGGEDDAAAAPRAEKVSAAASAGVVAPAKVEVIAGLTGCKPKIRIEADELREGVCRTEKADYVITTFPEERLKQTWLDSASVYGGTYLVGTRWVVGAKPEVLDDLRPKLGGEIQKLQGIGPAPRS